MSESENPEKNDGMTVVSGGVPADGASTLPAKVGGQISRMTTGGAKKLYGAIAPYVGNLMESGRVAAAGFALKQQAEGIGKHAESVAKLGDSYAKLSEQYGPEKAEQMLGASLETLSLRRRAGTRLLHMEEQRQQNIESVASQAAEKLPENVSEESVKPDWIARFIESVKDVSDKTMQSLWSSILAGEVEMPGQTSLRTLDVLKNLSQQDAQDFERILQFSISGKWVYYPVSLGSSRNDEEVANRIVPYRTKMHIDECGLIHSETNLMTNYSGVKVEYFSAGTFLVGIRPMLPKDNLDVTIPIFSISSVGREIARFVPAKCPEPWYIRELAKRLANSNAILRLESSLPQITVNPGQDDLRIISPLPGDEANISLTATDEELRTMLENCLCRVELK